MAKENSSASYTVTFDSNGGSKVPSQTVTYKALVKAPSKPTKEGHIFIGWYKNKDFTKAWDFAKDVVTEDLTLYAVGCRRVLAVVLLFTGRKI